MTPAEIRAFEAMVTALHTALARYRSQFGTNAGGATGQERLIIEDALALAAEARKEDQYE